jgi:ABC-type nitrate/sulfonate/bicarbonate transport system substrate-binding protein
MDNLDLRVAISRNDTTQPLFDGSVTIDGPRSVTVSTAATLPDIFRSLLDGEADVTEFGLTFLLRAVEAGTPLLAIPVFPTRVFRHSCVFVNAASGITSPADLTGRTIGEFGVYGQDSGVWIKGILMDEYGFRPEKNRWVIGGLDRPMPPFEFTTHPHPDDVEVTAVPDGKTLSGMLASGEIDALFTANVPQPVLDGSPAIRRLFPGYEAVERDYYRRTGIFPMMHALAARRDLLTGHPGLAGAVYDGFLRAKEAAADRYREGRRLYEVAHMLPWTNALFEANEQLFPRDWWPYGISANRTALETFLRYHHEQGLSSRLWSVDELFVPGL